MSAIVRSALAGVAFAAIAALGAGAAAGTLDKARQDKTVRLAVRADAPPFS